MVKKYNAEGKLVKYSVTQLDGSIRRTTFDPITGLQHDQDRHICKK